MSSRWGKLISRRRLRPYLLAAVVTFIVAEIVAFSPSSVEEGAPAPAAIEPETLLNQDNVTLAPGIPNDRIPEYSVEQFNYVSSQGIEKQWKLNADKAFMYSKEKLVHARRIEAFLFDPDGKSTIVTGKEAKYFMNQRDLEVFGDVHTVFPDGFELKSEYLRYRPNERKIEIPTRYLVKGDGHEKTGQNIQFESRGLDFAMARSQIVLSEAVKLYMIKREEPAAPSADGKDHDSRTTIESDHAVILRDKQLAHFTMSPRRPIAERFVRITQPTMIARGRRADLSYGDFSQMLNYLVVYDDVLVREIGTGESLRYGTGGKAVFDTKHEVVVLTEFPQVYQDNDTVTGDIILLHRDTDVVEVEHSNAFSQGTSSSTDGDR